MLGLLGTVVGLVEAFQKVAEMQERVSPASLASGIWAALITTVGGLFVTIPTLIAHHFFQGRVAHLAFRIEHYGCELLLLLKREQRAFPKRGIPAGRSGNSETGGKEAGGAPFPFGRRASLR